jgi:hypothetical protein
MKAKEKPILFSAPMVRAILAGQKTQTRRVINPQPKNHVILANDGKWYVSYYINPGVEVKPRYVKGDTLWVRETFVTAAWADCFAPRDVAKTTPIRYAADGTSGELVMWNGPDEEAGKLRPSIFMPRWMSRIALKVTAVRAERVSQISNEDARAEGAKLGAWFNYRNAFAHLWDSINAARGFGWKANPWVWAYTFRRVK